MLTEPTLDRLRALRLGAMADAYRTQLQDPAIGALSFDERVGLLVDAEHLSRDNRKLTRRLKEAKLRIPHACLEDLEYAPRRELDRALIRQLATGRWIAEHRNVLITGRDRRREDLPGVRAGPARVSAGLPGDLPALAALLSGAGARARRWLLHDRARAAGARRRPDPR